MPETASTGSLASDPGALLARYYDLDLLDDPGDLALYEALARRSDGQILELGVGSGRLAVPLAAQGHGVTAVDTDPAMIARASGAWQRATADAHRTDSGLGASDAGTAGVSPGSLELIEADMLDLHLPHHFGLVILALNSLLLLDDRASQQAALATMARHLTPDGMAVVDVWLPSSSDLALYDGRLLLEWQRPDPETGEQVAKSASALHDAATASVALTQIFDAWPPEGGTLRRIARTDTLRLVGADELVAMAREAGLRVEQLAGDHQMGEFGPGAERTVLVARLV